MLETSREWPVVSFFPLPPAITKFFTVYQHANCQVLIHYNACISD